MRKKGQISIEWGTVTTIILVVLVIVLGIVVNNLYGKIRLLSPEECLLAVGTGVYCKDHAADSTANTITLRLGNLLPDAVQITSVDITFPDDQCTAYTTATTVNPGEEVDIPVSCTLSTKQRVKGTVLVDYSAAGGLPKSIAGQISTTAK